VAEEVVEAEESKPKKPILMIIVAGVVLLVVLAAAIGGTLFATGFFDSKDKKAAEATLAELEGGKGGHGGKDDGHGGKDDGHGGKEGAAGKPATAASGPVAKTPAELQRFEYRYHEMEKDLVANLTASKKIMQVKVAIMTRYDDRVVNNVKKHELALRSVALDVMRKTKAEDIEQPDFRKLLAEKIRDEMNSTLQKFEDFGGIEEIMFTNFIVQ